MKIADIIPGETYHVQVPGRTYWVTVAEVTRLARKSKTYNYQTRQYEQRYDWVVKGTGLWTGGGRVVEAGDVTVPTRNLIGLANLESVRERLERHAERASLLREIEEAGAKLNPMLVVTVKNRGAHLVEDLADLLGWLNRTVDHLKREGFIS